MFKLNIKIRKYDGGFTLMEILVVLGLVGMIGALSLFTDLNNYRGNAFREEVNILGTALQTARADALNNIDQNRHGVAIHPGGYDGYIIFEGDNYATRITSLDVNIKSSYGITPPALPTEIVFDQLSGDANYDGDIVLTDPERNMNATISINHEGKISW